MPTNKTGRTAKLRANPRRPRLAISLGDQARRPEPLYVFLTEPGLSSLGLLELKHLKLVTRKARPKRLQLRNYDALVLPGGVVAPQTAISRLCTNVLRAPIFGASAVTPKQLDALAALFGQGRYKRLVSSLSGEKFNRPDLVRWLTGQLRERGVTLGDVGRSIWLLVVDEYFYFCEELQNYHAAPGRANQSSRKGALPPTIAAAMVFAARPAPNDVSWDPVAGSGGIVNELLRQNPGAVVMATDVDADAVADLGQRFAKPPGLWIARGDASSISLPRQDLSLTVANLPFGVQYKSKGGNAELYANIILNSLRHAGPRWRGVFLTSDSAAIAEAARRAGVSFSMVADIKVRGMHATMWSVERIAT